MVKPRTATLPPYAPCADCGHSALAHQGPQHACILEGCACPGWREIPSICPACAGTGRLAVRIQFREAGGRRCIDEQQHCWICHGTTAATQADVDAFFNEESSHGD